MKIALHVRISVPNERVREFDLEFMGPEVLIGRDRGCEIQIPLSDVSRNHARIFEDGGSWHIEDLESASGTMVNGEPLQAGHRQLLHPGDQIEIAHALMTFSRFHTKEEDQEDPEEKTSVVAQKMVRGILGQSEQNASLPYFLVIKGPNEGSKIPLRLDFQDLIIGRIESADLRIDDPNVSRRHARIRREWNQILIEDLGSKNGVAVNGRKIALPTRLKDSDEIYFGGVRVSFIDPAAHIIDRLDSIVGINAKIPAETEFDDEEGTQITQSGHAENMLVTEPLKPSTQNKRVSVFRGIGIIEALLAIFGATLTGALLFAVSLWLR